MTSQRNQLTKIKKLSIIGMIISALSFAAFFFIGKEADKGLMRLDQQQFGTPFKEDSPE